MEVKRKEIRLTTYSCKNFYRIQVCNCSRSFHIFIYLKISKNNAICCSIFLGSHDSVSPQPSAKNLAPIEKEDLWNKHLHYPQIVSTQQSKKREEVKKELAVAGKRYAALQLEKIELENQRMKDQQQRREERRLIQERKEREKEQRLLEKQIKKEKIEKEKTEKEKKKEERLKEKERKAQENQNRPKNPRGRPKKNPKSLD